MVSAQVNKEERYGPKYIKSSYVLDQKLTPQQTSLQVPVLVKDIVAANDAIGKTGFGPIGPNSLALYAGRWIDTVTGNIRVLPNASTKYLNPLSADQRLGYLQARILNHWNNLVKTAEQYNTLLRVKDKYEAKQVNSINKSFDPQRY